MTLFCNLFIERSG